MWCKKAKHGIQGSSDLIPSRPTCQLLPVPRYWEDTALGYYLLGGYLPPFSRLMRLCDLQSRIFACRGIRPATLTRLC